MEERLAAPAIWKQRDDALFLQRDHHRYQTLRSGLARMEQSLGEYDSLRELCESEPEGEGMASLMREFAGEVGEFQRSKAMWLALLETPRGAEPDEAVVTLEAMDDTLASKRWVVDWFGRMSGWIEARGGSLFLCEPKGQCEQGGWASVSFLATAECVFGQLREFQGEHAGEIVLPGPEFAPAKVRVVMYAVPMVAERLQEEDWRMEVFRPGGVCCHGRRHALRITHRPTQIAQAVTHEPTAFHHSQETLLKIVGAIARG